MYSFLFLTVTSLMLCLALTPLCRDLLLRAGWLDHPDQQRKTHARPTPRMGGIPIAIAYVGSFALLLLLPFSGGAVLGRHMPLVWKLLPAAGLMFATGLIDDMVTLKSWHKLGGQIAAALCAYFGGVQVLGIAGYEAGGWWSLPLTVVWLVGCANAFNLIDGVDGLATGIGLFATVTMAMAALLQGNLPLAIAMAPLAGALLGFLRYNFNPASIFLGDSGSLLIGFLLGCYGVLWGQKSATLLALAAPMMTLALPILDVFLSIARRFLRRQPIFGADRGHIHHRLLDRGHSPKQVALRLYCAGGLSALFSVAASVVPARFSGVILALFILTAWVFVRSLRYVEFKVARKILLGGGVRRMLGAEIHLENLENALSAATTPNDCWMAIREACRHLAIHRVRVSLLGEIYEEQFVPGKWSCWTIRIPVSDQDYVNCERALGCQIETIGIASLADLLGGALRARIPSLRPTGSIDPQIAALVAHSAGISREPDYGSVKVSMDAPAATATYCLPSME
ncbi:MAG TPA: MraY family glycosyltransferase [Bryobacteraceae bacterium]|jgi:UDP-GlcNAc:undecaprenyl-phosphate GlcNAc-1-phosphate transferase|nr:MraY family glycosyltransferase [Bryobacteraceae bacterium]